MNRRTFVSHLAKIPLLSPLFTLKAFGQKIESTPPLQRLAFGSCALQWKPQPVWRSIDAVKPDLFVFLGDNIYADTLNMEIMRERYSLLTRHPDFAPFRSKYPIIGTWDDHDYGANDSGAEYPQKVNSKEMLLEFLREPADSPRRKRDGVYTSYVYGDAPQRVQVILLDLRWFRSPLKSDRSGAYVPNYDLNAELLGEEQWAWLEEQLKVPADVRLLGSSSQLISDEHPWEKWHNFPRDRERLYRVIDQLDIRNLVILSGDMHYGEISSMKTPGGIELFDLTSSGMNYYEPINGAWTNSRRVGLFDTGCNYGLVQFDWNRSAPRVSLEVRDLANKVRVQKVVDLVRPRS